MNEFIIEDQIIFLYCSSLKETAAFYEKILGFDLVVDQGSCRVVRVAEGGGGYLGYCERLESERNTDGVIFTMVVPRMSEVDTWYALLLKRGVSIPDPPKFNPAYGIYHFFFSDPDGYTLEIQAFNDPDWKSAPKIS